MSISLVKLITEHPNILRKTLIEQARLEHLIENLEEDPDPDIEENDDQDGETYKPNFNQNREVVRLEAKVEKSKIQLKEAEGKASQAHRNIFQRATIATMSAAEDTDKTVIEIRLELADLNEKRKLLEIEAREGEWIRRNETKSPINYKQIDREQTKKEKQLEKAQADLEKINAEVEVLEAQFEGYKLLVSMGVTEI